MKPILFSTEMVKAILEGRKSMTRRIIKPKYSNSHFEYRTNKYGTEFIEKQNDIEGETYGKNPDGSTWHKLLGYIVPTPRYQSGDILWVRETWCKYYYADEMGYTHYDQPMTYYAADGTPDFGDIVDGEGFVLDDQRVKWKPSIHMPKAAARIFLRVTGVRAERLQEISQEDMIAEGCWQGCTDCFTNTGGCMLPDVCAYVRDSWETLWDGINAERGFSWASNPWVWVISFERCEKPEVVV